MTDSDISSITSARGLHSISESAGFDPNAPIAASRMMQVQTKLNQYKLRLREALAKKKQLQAEMALQTERAKSAHERERREHGELNAHIAELKEACATKDGEIGALKERLAELEGNTDLHRQLAVATAAVESLRAQLKEAETATTELKKQIAKMRVELDKARAKSAAQATEIDKLIMVSVAECEATKLELARAAAQRRVAETEAQVSERAAELRKHTANAEIEAHTYIVQQLTTAQAEADRAKDEAQRLSYAIVAIIDEKETLKKQLNEAETALAEARTAAESVDRRIATAAVEAVTEERIRTTRSNASDSDNSSRMSRHSAEMIRAAEARAEEARMHAMEERERAVYERAAALERVQAKLR